MLLVFGDKYEGLVSFEEVDVFEDWCSRILHLSVHSGAFKVILPILQPLVIEGTEGILHQNKRNLRNASYLYRIEPVYLGDEAVRLLQKVLIVSRQQLNK